MQGLVQNCQHYVTVCNTCQKKHDVGNWHHDGLLLPLYCAAP